MKLRSLYLLGLLIVVVLLFISLGLQFFEGFVPCPLCTLQRITFILLATLFLVGVIISRWSLISVLLNILILIASGIGIGLAGRQVWLQYFSKNIEACGVSIQYMLQAFPLKEVFFKILSGSAECTQKGWRFLSLDIAEWSLIWFILFFIFGIYLLIRVFSNKQKYAKLSA